MKSSFMFTIFFFALLLTSCQSSPSCKFIYTRCQINRVINQFGVCKLIGVVMSERMQGRTNDVLMKPVTCNTDRDCAKFCRGPILKCMYHTCLCVPGNPNCCQKHLHIYGFWFLLHIYVDFVTSFASDLNIFCIGILFTQL